MTMRTITFDDERWQVVPRVATHSMLRLTGGEYPQDRWSTVLSVAPEPPAQQPPEPAAQSAARDAKGALA